MYEAGKMKMVFRMRQFDVKHLHLLTGDKIKSKNIWLTEIFFLIVNEDIALKLKSFEILWLKLIYLNLIHWMLDFSIHFLVLAVVFRLVALIQNET